MPAAFSVSNRPLYAADSTHRDQQSVFELPLTAILFGTFAVIAFTWPKFLAVWQSGAFFDSDDAMRMVQVRDWLSGQGWFDMVAYRLDPPHGVLMHWTRITDVPIGFLIRFFETFSTPDTAERIARIVYPLSLLIAFFATLVPLAKRLAGAQTVVLACILAAFSFSFAPEFAAGRITHHSAQIVLLALMLGLTLDVLDSGRIPRAILAGGLASLSLAITIENMPFVVAMITIVAIAWIARGATMAPALAALGGTFAIGAVLVFATTIPPQRYGADVCDVFSVAYLLVAVAGGVGLGALALVTHRLSSPVRRTCGVVAVAGAAITAVALTFPDCLKDPHSSVDPLVRELWLSNVNQAKPMWRLIVSRPLDAMQLAVPLFLGLTGAIVAACKETGMARARWLAVVGFVAVGIAGAMWQLRVAHSVAPLAVLGALWPFERLRRWAAPRSRVLAALPFVVAATFTPWPWAFATPSPVGTSGPKYGNPQLCFAPASIVALDALPPSLVFAPIDSGPYILALTHHAVLGGPYHRNNDGNRFVIDVMLARPEAAHQLLRGRGVHYVAICPAIEELSIYVARAPNGLAALLRGHAAPAWLERVNVNAAPFAVYQIK